MFLNFKRKSSSLIDLWTSTYYLKRLPWISPHQKQGILRQLAHMYLYRALINLSRTSRCILFNIMQLKYETKWLWENLVLKVRCCCDNWLRWSEDEIIFMSSQTVIKYEKCVETKRYIVRHGETSLSMLRNSPQMKEERKRILIKAFYGEINFDWTFSCVLILTLLTSSMSVDMSDKMEWISQTTTMRLSPDRSILHQANHAITGPAESSLDRPSPCWVGYKRCFGFVIYLKLCLPSKNFDWWRVCFL